MAWQEVPGEFRNALRRIIVTQGDTEPASVEQQRLLCSTAPSLYDCRNLFQVNVEEGRHLWAMVYLLHAHFGRDGREEAEELLERRSGDFDKPRILYTGALIVLLPCFLPLVGEAGGPGVSIEGSPWPSDHRAVVTEFTVRPAPMPDLLTTDRRVYREGDEIKVRYLFTNVPDLPVARNDMWIIALRANPDA